MIGGADEPYVMLMASLPAHGPLLANATPVISAIRLEERLRFLSPEDRADLDALGAALAWSRIPLGTDDATYLAHVNKTVSTIRNPCLRNMIRDRLEVRTLLAALRRRHAGHDAPAQGEPWGFGRFTETIRKNWSQPDFGVVHSFPWVNRARERLQAGDSASLERIALQAAWDATSRYANGHFFDFEAVVCYVVKWYLADHWVHYDVAASTARFAALLDAACGEASDVGTHA